MNYYPYSAFVVLASVPLVTLGAIDDFKGLVGVFTDIIGSLVILVFGLTFLVFIWGIIKGWIIKGSEPEGIKEGKSVVLVGIITLVIMISIWGILYMLQSSIFGS